MAAVFLKKSSELHPLVSGKTQQHVKRKSKPKEPPSPPERPLTATLERPRVLDLTLVGHLDMTMLTREALVLALSSLPARRQAPKRGRGGGGGGKSQGGSPARNKPPKPSTSITSSITLIPSSKRAFTVVSDPPSMSAIPSPCRTCGRPEAPERLHSHPNTAIQTKKTTTNSNAPKSKLPITAHGRAPTKSSVRRPVPVKYSKSRPAITVVSTTTTTTNSTSPTPVPPTQPTSRRTTPEPPDSLAQGPRGVMCYVCGREFGRASFGLHEPHCLQRWHRENAQLPKHLQRPTPKRPQGALTRLEWNAQANREFQNQLIACECGRTFAADRLPVHQRTCAKHLQNAAETAASEPSQTESRKRSGGPVLCYICGRMFGTRSISIHEPHCLERWRLENEKLPEHQRRQEPIRPASNLGDREAGMQAAWESHLSQLVPCTYCKRTFNPDRIEVHERACKAKT